MKGQHVIRNTYLAFVSYPRDTDLKKKKIRGNETDKALKRMHAQVA